MIAEIIRRFYIYSFSLKYIDIQKVQQVYCVFLILCFSKTFIALPDHAYIFFDMEILTQINYSLLGYVHFVDKRKPWMVFVDGCFMVFVHQKKKNIYPW